jgi:hypothetical protein
LIINLKRFSPQACQFGEGFSLICCQLPAMLLVNVMNIRTNNVPRELKFLSDFSASDQDKIRKQYDWMEPSDLECNYGFFKYRNCFYHLSDFMRVADESTGDLAGWDGYAGDSYFSGTLMKLVDNDCDHVIVGRYFS